MRFALVIYGSLATVSGGYLYDRKLVEHLEVCGDRVELVSLPWRGYARHLGDNFSAALLARLRRLDVDALLQDELNHPSLFWLNRRLSGGRPRLAIVHHLRCSEQRPAWQNRLYAAVEHRYLQSVDGFIYNSETTRAAVERLHPGAARRPWVTAQPAGDSLPTEITPAEIEARSRLPGPLQVVFLGNLIERKGLHDLLRALALLPPDGCALWVIGGAADPAYARRMQQIAADPALAGRVEFLGSLPSAALAARLRAAHVLAVPSSYEGFGIAYLEGMAFGLPALATTQGGAAEIITPGVDGFLVPPGSPAAIAQVLQALHADRGWLAGLSLAARRRYAAQPTWEQSAARIRAFLTTFNRPQAGNPHDQSV